MKGDINSIDISFIVPVYNVEQYIEECLLSILDSSMEFKSEIIIINDGSVDNSMSIVYGYCLRFSSIKVINQNNLGLSTARNVGLSLARGKYVAFIDSDDYIDDNIKTIVEIAINSESDIIVGNYLEFDDLNRNFHSLMEIDAKVCESYAGLLFFRKYYRQLRSMVWRSIYKREFLLNNNIQFHEGVFFEDVEFTPIAICAANDVIYSGVVFYHYRKRNNSITTSVSSIKKITDTLSIWNVLNDKSQSLSDDKVRNIFIELGFYLFLNQYVKFTDKLPYEIISLARTMAGNSLKINRFEPVRWLFFVLPQSLFHKLLRIILK